MYYIVLHYLGKTKKTIMWQHNYVTKAWCKRRRGPKCNILSYQIGPSQVLADSFNALSALLPIMSFEAIDLKQFRFVIVLFRKY